MASLNINGTDLLYELINLCRFILFRKQNIFISLPFFSEAFLV